ncbi:MAG: nucleoside triphosphate pyrophosphohydrolase [Aquisalimonadaceae bacterium]
MRKLLGIMARLRDLDSGCPWDIEQTFASIAPYTLEEAYEVVDAIQREAMDDLRDELGDLLLQVVFHAQMAREAGYFEFDDVVAAVNDKMVRRHPHVFGDAQVDDAAAQTRAWEQIKAQERAVDKPADQGPPSALDGVSLAMPGLPRAVKLTRRASRVGFDWPNARGVFDKVREELAELEAEYDTGGGHQRLEDELGDLLFATANLARHLNVDPETALRGTTARFERRFHAMEEEFRQRGQELSGATFAEREQAWENAKQAERNRLNQEKNA